MMDTSLQVIMLERDKDGYILVLEEKMTLSILSDLEYPHEIEKSCKKWFVALIVLAFGLDIEKKKQLL